MSGRCGVRPRMSAIDNHFFALRESWCRLIEDLGLQYNFVAYGQIEQGELLKRGYRVLILPRSSALSTQEVREIRTFAQQGGTVIADGTPGTFDEHSRKREQSALSDLLPDSAGGNGRGKDHPGWRHGGLSSEPAHRQRRTRSADCAASALSQRRATPNTRSPTTPAGIPTGIETHLFRNGGVTIIGLLTNPQLRVK